MRQLLFVLISLKNYSLLHCPPGTLVWEWGYGYTIKLGAFNYRTEVTRMTEQLHM